MEKQKTLKKNISVSGIGLHTGNTSTITFCPAPVNYGFRFVRTDISGQPEIPALVDFVIDLSRGTTIGKNGVEVHTVEHVLAALAGLKIDNCKIEIDTNEPPVIDGSSLPYVKALLEAGLEDQDADREVFVIDEAVRFTNDNKHVDIVALPTDDFRITVMVDYFNPALGSQHTGLFNLEKEFVEDFAPARTFCFLTEVEMLHDQGLIKGGKLDNAIVIIDKEINQEVISDFKRRFDIECSLEESKNGILNNISLRFKNEPARHKLLDMIGDLALIGVPVKAQILAARPGHESNVEFAKKIRELYLKKKSLEKYDVNKAKSIVFDVYQILDALPHRYPFLLVDRIIDLDTEKNVIIGYKNVTFNEPFFPGHFPGKPIMPGVLIIEALAQTGGLLILKSFPNLENKMALFTNINNAKFRKPVVPGDQLVMELTLIGKRFNIFNLSGKAFVNGQLVAQADLQAAIVDK